MQQTNESNQPFEVKSFSSDDKSTILLTPLFIVMGAKKDELSALTTTIKSNLEGFKPSDDLSIIYLDTIDDMEYRDNLSCLDINYQSEGNSKYNYLSFENNDVLNDFLKAFHSYTNNAFVSSTMLCNRKEAATYPLIAAAVVIAGGSLLTYIVNLYHDYVPPRTMIVKAFVYYFYQFCRIVGPYPVAILTVVLVCICLRWLIKSIKNPPMKTIFNKK